MNTLTCECVHSPHVSKRINRREMIYLALGRDASVASLGSLERVGQMQPPSRWNPKTAHPNQT